MDISTCMLLSSPLLARASAFGAGWQRSARARRVRGVTVLGDFLRPTHEGLPGGVDGQIAWLHLAIRNQVAAACGLQPRLLSITESAPLQALLSSERPAADAARYWTTWHERALPRTAFRDALAAWLAGQFCIGYELPPYLSRLLDALDIPYLDLRIHPVRFLDDLLFAARASDVEMAGRLAKWAVPHSVAANAAGLHEATARLRPRPTRRPGTLLVIGQRPEDATQLAGGCFFDAATIRSRLGRLCPAHTPVLLKDHPSGERHSLVTQVLAARPDAQFTTCGIYPLLADPGITRVLTVNSSVAYEARFFDKAVTTLLPLPVHLAWRGDPVTPANHVAIDDGFLTADFWRCVLAPHTDVTTEDGCRLAPKRNRLRVALDAFWGYRDADAAGPVPPSGP